jgi:hypothetical protein
MSLRSAFVQSGVQRSRRMCRRNLRKSGVSLVLLITFFLASCEPVNFPITSVPQVVTQIPFFASDTPPPFIIPVTETPSPTLTPGLPLEITLTPTVLMPAAKWWEVYFTDPLVINNPDVIPGSIEEKLIHLHLSNSI